MDKYFSGTGVDRTAVKELTDAPPVLDGLSEVDAARVIQDHCNDLRDTMKHFNALVWNMVQWRAPHKSTGEKESVVFASFTNPQHIDQVNLKMAFLTDPTRWIHGGYQVEICMDTDVKKRVLAKRMELNGNTELVMHGEVVEK